MQPNGIPNARQLTARWKPENLNKKMRGAGRQFSGTSPHTAHNAIITCIHYNKTASSTPTNTYVNARPVGNGPYMMCMECYHALIIKYQWPIDLHKYTFPLSIYYNFCCRKVNIFHRLIVFYHPNANKGNDKIHEKQVSPRYTSVYTDAHIRNFFLECTAFRGIIRPPVP